MKRGLGSLGLALAFAGLLASLSLVVWRQSRSMDTLRALEEIRAERVLVEAQRWEHQRRIQYLESRGRVEPAARSRLGMHVPSGAEEMIILPIDDAHSRLFGGGRAPAAAEARSAP